MHVQRRVESIHFILFQSVLGFLKIQRSSSLGDCGLPSSTSGGERGVREYHLQDSCPDGKTSWEPKSLVQEPKAYKRGSDCPGPSGTPGIFGCWVSLLILLVVTLQTYIWGALEMVKIEIRDALCCSNKMTSKWYRASPTCGQTFFSLSNYSQ